LFTNDEEILCDARRPIILNGIEEVVGRSDLSTAPSSCRCPPFQTRLVALNPRSCSSWRS
jgi:hypothetical protein